MKKENDMPFLDLTRLQLDFLETSCDWAFVTNDDGVVVFCHKSKSATYDVLAKNLVGQQFASFLPQSERKRVMQTIAETDFSKGQMLDLFFQDPLVGVGRLKATSGKLAGFQGLLITVSSVHFEEISKIKSVAAKMEAEASEIGTQTKQQELIAEIAFSYAKNEELSVGELFEGTIEKLGKFMGVDRCLIFKHDLFSRSYSVVHEWHAPHVHANKAFLQNIPYNDDDEGFIQLTTRPYIAVADTFQFEGEAYKVQRETGVHAFVDLPILIHGKFWGFLGADYSQPHYWEESEFHMLKTIGSIMSSALRRDEMQKALEETTLAASKASSAKTDFLSRMSHEIRTPMNAIIGMSEIAKKSTDISRIQYCLAKIDQASHQLLGIINDILDLSKIESGKMEIASAEFDFEKLLQNTYNVVQARVDEKNIEFYFNVENGYNNYVFSDELRISQLIINFLSNAVKFTPEGGRITLKSRFFVDENSSHYLRVDVVDTGIGIKKENQERLFLSFEQADGSITRQYGGTGLGLSICKSIVELMNGRIFLESEEGKGSTFSFEIPIAFGKRIEEKIKVKIPTSTRILVVDDSEDVLESCQNIIEGFKMTCDVADSGAKAIEILKQAKKPYNIIFIDWKMPDMDGIQTAKIIQDIVSPETIVIMISSADWDEMRDEAVGIGVTHYLPKPLLPSALFDTIVELLSSEQARIKKQNVEKGFIWDDKTILIAEDIEINREIVQTLLEPTKVNIVFAENGLVAVEKFMSHPTRYDVILMDIQMPVMDGLDATRKIRGSHHQNGKTVPILAMTANAFSKDIEDCLNAGMNGHVSKPVDINELMDKLDVYLK